MKPPRNGYIYYELLMCFILIITLIYFLLVPINQLNINFENQKLTYKMKQILALNIVLFENGEILTSSDTYELKKVDDYLCIEWWDVKDEKRSYCEKIWL